MQDLRSGGGGGGLGVVVSGFGKVGNFRGFGMLGFFYMGFLIFMA